MSDKYLPGDKVRVTIEGTVHRHCGHSLELRNEFGNASHEIFTNQSDVKVEKIEPPVEVFKPGDLIRHKGSQVTFLVTSEGYVDMTSG
ncbi:MAG TPA: hypothetical protein VFH56_03360, partial [Acidimicrobiales bacterium]|nr:hypothetical protein [Acidimicrobiales bacterium]